MAFKPSGITAVQFSKLVLACIKSKLVDFEDLFITEGVMDSLQNAFLTASTNNILHNQYAAIIKFIVGRASGSIFDHVFASDPSSSLPTIWPSFSPPSTH